MNALKVRPGLTDVQLNPDPEGHRQAIGLDSKGRQQSYYLQSHKDRAAAAKYFRAKAFGKIIPKIKSEAHHLMVSGRENHITRDAAAIISIIAKTGLRVGSGDDTQADVEAFGAGTLQKEHVSVEGNKVTLTFTGKSGVQQTKQFEDGSIARYLERRMKKKKEGEPLFDASYSTVKRVFKSLAGNGFSPKDFRTWYGTALARKTLKGLPKPVTKTEALAVKKEVLRVVSDFLGNTPTMAMNSYVDPSIWSPIAKLLTVKSRKKKRKS